MTNYSYPEAPSTSARRPITIERKPATSFTCPHCGVKPGVRCVTPGLVWRLPHQSRLRLVEKQYDADRHAETIQLLANRSPLKSS